MISPFDRNRERVRMPQALIETKEHQATQDATLQQPDSADARAADPGAMQISPRERRQNMQGRG